MEKVPNTARAAADPRPERRRYLRVADMRLVEISFSDPAPVTVVGQLVDSSVGGFRVTHTCKELVPGIEVRIRRVEQKTSQRARIIWTHLLDGRRVSGCLIL